MLGLGGFRWAGDHGDTDLIVLQVVMPLMEVCTQ